MPALLRPEPPPSHLVRAAQARLVAVLRDREAEPTSGADNEPAPPQSATPWPGPLRAPAEGVDDERYQFGEVFAAGGLGVVRKARDRRLGRTIAVKELLRSDPAAERRFALEAAITARLQHPGIVPLYDIGRYPTGEPYYCMKLVEGQSLAHKIHRCKDLGERLGLLEHLIAAADAIAYAHRNHIVHRDLKPANILIGELGETVVIDWGLAKDLCVEAAEDASVPGAAALAGDATQDGAVLGTLRYMPPEQALGLSIDERSDVYSLGAVLHHILAGAPPYAELDERQLARRVCEGSVIDLQALVPEAPRELVAIVRRAMAPAPAQRYASAEALVDDLRRFRTGRMVGAHRYGPTEALRLWSRRHRPALAVASAAVVALFGVGGFAVQNIRQERDAATVAQAHAQSAEAATGVALTAARERGDAALLAQARGVLSEDPAAVLTALAQLDLSEETSLRSARLLAQAAESRGAPTSTLRGHTRPIAHMRALASGELVSLDVGGAVWRWDPRTGAGTQVLDLAEEHTRLVIARDAPVFAAVGARRAQVVAGDGVIHSIDLTALPYGADNGPHYAFVLSADGQVLAALTQPVIHGGQRGGAAAYRWDLSATPIVAEAVSAGRMGEAVMSPDGQTIAYEREQAPMMLLQGEVGTPVPALRRPLGFSSSGRHLYGLPPGPKPRLIAWDVDTGATRALGSEVLALAADDHALVLDFDGFMNEAVLSLRSLATGEARWTRRFPRSKSWAQWGDHAEFGAEVDPNGVGLAIRDGDRWLLGDLRTGQLTRTLDVGRHLRGVWLPGGDFAVAHGTEIWTWSRPVPAPIGAGDLGFASISPAGAHAIVYDHEDRRPVVLDMSSGTVAESSCLAGATVDALTHGYARRAIDDTGRVYFSDVEGRACVARAGGAATVLAQPGRATAVALGDGESLAVGLGDGGLLLWERPQDPPRRIELGAEVVTLVPAHAGAGHIVVTHAGVQAVSRTGVKREIVGIAADDARADRMASVAVVAHPRAALAAVLLPGDNALHLHDFAAGVSSSRTVTLATPVAAYSPSGAQLAVAAAGRRLQIFRDVDDPGRSFTLPDEVESLAFLDEDQLAVVGDGGALLRVDAATGESAVLQRDYIPHEDFYRVRLVVRPGAALLGHGTRDMTVVYQPLDTVPHGRAEFAGWLTGRGAALTGM